MRNRVPLTGMLPDLDEYNIGDLVYAKISTFDIITEELALVIEEAVPGIYTVQPVGEPQTRRNVTPAQLRKASDHDD